MTSATAGPKGVRDLDGLANSGVENTGLNAGTFEAVGFGGMTSSDLSFGELTHVHPDPRSFLTSFAQPIGPCMPMMEGRRLANGMGLARLRSLENFADEIIREWAGEQRANDHLGGLDRIVTINGDG
jgi:hypothetical protein